MPEEQDEPWPARAMEQQFGLRRGQDLHYTEEYGLKSAFAPLDMASLYQSWDGLLYLSGGEGFGLPAWEAMCSALPVVYTNYSSHAEFLRLAGAGLPVGGVLQPEPRTCLWRMIADVPQAIEAIRRLYFDPTLRTTLGSKGAAFVNDYGVNSQVDRWHRLFSDSG